MTFALSDLRYDIRTARFGRIQVQDGRSVIGFIREYMDYARERFYGIRVGVLGWGVILTVKSS